MGYEVTFAFPQPSGVIKMNRPMLFLSTLESRRTHGLVIGSINELRRSIQEVTGSSR